MNSRHCNGDWDWDWERAVILELQREHDYICRTYKVRLRPIAITLFESTARWGQFDQSAPLIALSRRLIQEFKWDRVLAVFRHEVAHQIVAEENPHHTEGPHGPLFKIACRRIGLAAHFARAGIDLTSTELDWRLDPQSPEVERILDRVKKLLALATSGNEHEAVLAMARVRELYAKYNLEQMEKLGQTDFVHLVIDAGKLRLPTWEHSMLALLARHFFVRVLTFGQYQAVSGKRAQAVEIIGTRENVLMAEYVYHFLSRQIESLLLEAVRTTGIQRRERTSFRLGVLHGFGKKLAATEAPSASGPTVLGRALVQFRGDPKMDAYLAEVHPRLGTKRRGSITIESGAFAAGRAAGHAINLNKPLTDSGGASGRLLGTRRGT